MSPRIIRIATRESPLALWQATFIQKQLLSRYPKLQIELLPLKTSGDKFLKDKLLKVGGKGLFVKELEEALLDGRADLAVHSMKDVPAQFPKGLTLQTICQRHSPYDAFVSKRYQSLAAAPKGCIIGTSSLRRQSQLLTTRPDLNIQFLRGNIHTRLKKMASGEYDAIILAVSGLERMAMHEQVNEILDSNLMLPACGQGALGIECRENDTFIHEKLAPLNDALSALCVRTERQVNALLGGHCHAPIAIFCEVQSNKSILLRAKVATPDGKTTLYDERSGPHENAMTIANQCADTLLNAGANQILNQLA